MAKKQKIDIYTDGACKGNPGPGGWAAVIFFDGEDKHVISGREERTTNQRMEVLAAIKGLEATPKGSEATVRSDSEYVVNTMTKNWKRRVNNDLWDRLDRAVASRKVKFQWVRGHDGDPGNEEADAWASWEAGLVQDQPIIVEVDETPQLDSLTHLDEEGTARMVDVGSKLDTEREAVARGFVSMKPETLRLIKEGSVEKGDVLSTARLAGITAAKWTPQLIPLCHPIPLNHVTVELEPDEEAGGVRISATATATAKTGVEMEALTAVSVAALTIYDMCKAVDRGMRIQDVRLVSKRGGKSGDIVLEE